MTQCAIEKTCVFTLTMDSQDSSIDRRVAGEARRRGARSSPPSDTSRGVQETLVTLPTRSSHGVQGGSDSAAYGVGTSEQPSRVRGEKVALSDSTRRGRNSRKKIEKVSGSGAIKSSSVSTTNMNTAKSSAHPDTTATAARRSRRRKPTGKEHESSDSSPVEASAATPVEADGDWTQTKSRRQRKKKISAPVTQEVTQLATFTFDLPKEDGTTETYTVSLPMAGTKPVTHKGITVIETPCVGLPLDDGTTKTVCLNWFQLVFRAPFAETPRPKPACSIVNGVSTSCKHPKRNLCWFHLTGNCMNKSCNLYHIDLDRAPVTKTIVTPAASAEAKPVVKQVKVKSKPRGKEKMCEHELIRRGSCRIAKCPHAHSCEELMTEQYRRDFSDSLTSPDTLAKAYHELNRLVVAHPLLVGYKQEGCPFVGRLQYLFETTELDELKNGFAPNRFTHLLELWYRMASFFRSGYWTANHGKADAVIGLGVDNEGMDCTLWELARRASIPCSKAVMLSTVDALVENPSKTLRKKYVCTGGFYCTRGFHQDSFIDLSALTGCVQQDVDIGALPTKLSSALHAFAETQDKLTLQHQIADASKQVGEDEWVDASAKKVTQKALDDAKKAFSDAGDCVHKAISGVYGAIISNPSQFFKNKMCAVKDYKQTPLVSAVKATAPVAKAVSQKELKKQKAEKKAAKAQGAVRRKEKAEAQTAAFKASAAADLLAHKKSLNPGTVLTRVMCTYNAHWNDFTNSLKRCKAKAESSKVEEQQRKYQKKVEDYTKALADLEEENATLLSMAAKVRDLMAQLDKAKTKAHRDVSRIVYAELARVITRQERAKSDKAPETTPEKLADRIGDNFKRLTMKKQELGMSEEDELHFTLHSDYLERLAKKTSVTQLQTQLDAAVLELHNLG